LCASFLLTPGKDGSFTVATSDLLVFFFPSPPQVEPAPSARPPGVPSQRMTRILFVDGSGLSIYIRPYSPFKQTLTCRCYPPHATSIAVGRPWRLLGRGFFLHFPGPADPSYFLFSYIRDDSFFAPRDQGCIYRADVSPEARVVKGRLAAFYPSPPSGESLLCPCDRSRRILSGSGLLPGAP